MICPRCGKPTDERYQYCVNCGFLVQQPKPDKTVDLLARVLVWLIVISAIAGTALTIIILLFMNNMMQGIP
jgi:hypothetical protein